MLSTFFKDYQTVIGRFGGEEFCILLSHVGREKAEELANKLCREIEKTKIILRREETAITVSIGVATLPIDASDEKELIFKADRALLAAKQEGKNRVVHA